MIDRSLSIPSPILEGAPRSPASGGSTPRGGGGSPTSPNPATTPREQAMRNNARGRPMLSGKILKNVLDSKPGPGSPQTPQTPVGVGRQVLVKLAPNDKEVYYFILVTTPREREQVFAFRRKIGMQVYSTAEESGDFADAYDDGAVHIGVWKEVQGNRGMLEKEPWAYARGHMTASNSPLKHYDFPLPRVVERMSDCIFIDHILVSVDKPRNAALKMEHKTGVWEYMKQSSIFLVLGLLQAMARTRQVMNGTKWIFLCASPNSPVAAKLADDGVKPVKSLSVKPSAPAFYQYSRCLHLASTSVQYFQDSRRRPSVKLPMSSRLDPTVEQQIGALPLPTKRAARVVGGDGESYTIFKFGQSMESVYHIRVLRKEVDLLAAADLRERMSKMTAGDGGNPAGTFAVLDQYEKTAIHLGFYKEVQRNVLGKMMGTARVHVDLLESPAPYQYDLDLGIPSCPRDDVSGILPPSMKVKMW